MWQQNMFYMHLGSRAPHAHLNTQKTHTALLQIVLTRTSSTTKTNTCKRVTLRGCNLQENPIWQSSCQRGSQIDCSRGAHRVASCPSTRLYQLHTHTHTHTHTHIWRRALSGIRPDQHDDKFMPLVLIGTCRMAQQASLSFEQGLIFTAQCIDLTWGISVAKKLQGLAISDMVELKETYWQKWSVHLSVYCAGWLSKTLSPANENLGTGNLNSLSLSLSIYLSLD